MTIRIPCLRNCNHFCLIVSTLSNIFVSILLKFIAWIVQQYALTNYCIKDQEARWINFLLRPQDEQLVRFIRHNGRYFEMQFSISIKIPFVCDSDVPIVHKSALVQAMHDRAAGQQTTNRMITWLYDAAWCHSLCYEILPTFRHCMWMKTSCYYNYYKAVQIILTLILLNKWFGNYRAACHNVISGCSEFCNLNPAWISDYVHYKMWDEITYPFPNINGATVAVWEWVSNLIPHFTSSLPEE